MNLDVLVELLMRNLWIYLYVMLVMNIMECTLC
jgi:hypothetical protein